MKALKDNTTVLFYNSLLQVAQICVNNIIRPGEAITLKDIITEGKACEKSHTVCRFDITKDNMQRIHEDIKKAQILGVSVSEAGEIKINIEGFCASFVLYKSSFIGCVSVFQYLAKFAQLVGQKNVSFVCAEPVAEPEPIAEPEPVAEPAEEVATVAPVVSEVAPKSNALHIVDYSIKAFALLGTSRELSAQLREMGGAYNPRLSCGAGWIFSKKRLQQVREAFGIAC